MRPPVHTKIVDLVIWPTNLKTLIFAILFQPLQFRLSDFKCTFLDDLFPFIPKVWTLWPWLWPLTYISENFKICLTFKPLEVGLFNFTCTFIVTRVICSYRKFGLLTYISDNIDICHNFWTIYRAYIPCDETFLIIQKPFTRETFMTFDLNIFRLEK